MLTAYGITTLVSLCMVGLCVIADKKRDIWLLLLFVSVCICNLGYFMTALSKDLSDALNSNRIAYLGSVFPYGQWCWYAYYTSMILIPQLCVYAANHIGKPENYRLPKTWHLLYVPSFLLIGGILTNDVHFQTFVFTHGYEMGWSVYEHGPVYYLGAVWIFGCIAMMIGLMIKRCRIPGPQKTVWLPIAMLGIATVYSLAYAANSGIFGFIEMPVALCFTVVAIWESSIKTGLIPSNSHYDSLLRSSGLGMTVVDESYTIRYASADALPLSQEDMTLADAQLGTLWKGLRISKAPIRSGHVLWQEDVSDLMDALEELTALREELEGGGLSTLRRCIEREGGTMTVDSVPQFRLTVSLPKSKEDRL